MTRSEREVEAAIEQLGEVWKYNKESPASHRTVEEGAKHALEDVLDDDVDTELLHAYLDDNDEEFNSFENLFNFGYVDAILWYLERETLSERLSDEPAIGDPLAVE